MPAPVIRQFVGTIPDKGQSQTAFDTNVDAFLDWQALQFAPDLVAFGTFADTTVAALVAANLPPLTGQALDAVRVNAAADGVEFADVTAAGWALLDDADAAAQRTTLGLGSAALMVDSADADLAVDPDGAARRDIVAAAIAAGAVITKTYASSGQTITNGGLLTLSHGMGLEPKITQYVLQCTTAEHGFSIGDRINVSSYTSGASTPRQMNVVVTTTQIQIRFVDETSGIQIGVKSTGSPQPINNSRWQLYVRAFA